MVYETLGNYRFIKDDSQFVIESSRGFLLKAKRLAEEERMWQLEDTHEIFSTFESFWDYVSQWLKDAQSLLWPTDRSEEYFEYIDSVLRKSLLQ
jgi:hypothetical protein